MPYHKVVQIQSADRRQEQKYSPFKDIADKCCPEDKNTQSHWNRMQIVMNQQIYFYNFYVYDQNTHAKFVLRYTTME